MELLIGLAIVLAMSEYREHRSRILIKRLTLEMNKSKRAVDRLLERNAKVSKDVKDALVAANQSYKASMECRTTSIETQDKISEIKLSVETILKEYELNGVPLGYQRKNFDVVEGL